MFEVMKFSSADILGKFANENCCGSICLVAVLGCTCEKRASFTRGRASCLFLFSFSVSTMVA